MSADGIRIRIPDKRAAQTNAVGCAAEGSASNEKHNFENLQH